MLLRKDTVVKMEEPKKKLKIFHGMSDVAGQGSYSARGLRSIGADAVMAVWRRNPFGYSVDIDLHVKEEKIKNPIHAIVYSFRIFCFALKAMFKYDIFHFHFGRSLLPFGLDLFWLRLFNKRIIMEFHGDDIRYFYNRERPQYYPYEKLVTRKKWGIKRNNDILRYADTVITHDEELRKHIPHKNLYITPLRIDIDKLSLSYPDSKTERIVIVHAPSDFIGKGSKYVVASIEELKIKYNIDFILVEKKTQEEAFELYKMADIIVDQLFAQTYGVFAVEAMLMGKPVVGWISDEIKKTFPREMPIVSATIDTLTEVLEELILDGERRRNLGIAGRKYVEKYHDYRKVAQVQMDIYQNAICPMSTLESFEYAGNKVVGII